MRARACVLSVKLIGMYIRWIMFWQIPMRIHSRRFGGVHCTLCRNFFAVRMHNIDELNSLMNMHMHLIAFDVYLAYADIYSQAKHLIIYQTISCFKRHCRRVWLATTPTKKHTTIAPSNIDLFSPHAASAQHFSHMRSYGFTRKASSRMAPTTPSTSRRQCVSRIVFH